MSVKPLEKPINLVLKYAMLYDIPIIPIFVLYTFKSLSHRGKCLLTVCIFSHQDQNVLTSINISLNVTCNTAFCIQLTGFKQWWFHSDSIRVYYKRYHHELEYLIVHSLVGAES